MMKINFVFKQRHSAKQTRLFALAALFLLHFSFLSAQMAVGEWQAHFAYHNATDCATLGGKVWVVSDGSLYSYNPADSYVEIYNKCTQLSDQGIQYMRRCDAENLLLIVYQNANIDLLYPDETVVNLPDYYQKSTFDPVIRDVTVSGSYAYLTTTFGLVVLNLQKQEFANTYRIGEDVVSCAAAAGSILATTYNGVRMGNTSENLLDPAAWKTLNDVYFSQVVSFDGQYVAVRPSGGIWTIKADNTLTRLVEGTFTRLTVNDKRLFAWRDDHTVLIYSSLDTIPKTFTLPTGIVSLTYADDRWWAASGTDGLQGFEEQGGQLTLAVPSLIPDSPFRNYCDYITFTPDERLLVAGGCLDYFGTTAYPGTVAMLDDDGWHHFQEEGIAEATGIKYGYRNATCIAEDPTDPTHHFVSSFGQGIYEFRDGRYVSNINSSNSLLETTLEDRPHYTRISRLKYDSAGNLWLTNCHSQAPVKVITPDGTIHPLYYEDLREQETVTDILFSSHGLTWIVVMRVETSLFCIDDGGTPLDTSDDRTRIISTHFIDQDGTSTTLDYIYDIAEDHDGTIWVLTNQGPYLIPNPTEYFSPTFTFTKLKIPRNDGTNFADYLLDGVYTTCIAIDDANRKWIGTQNNGLYLISADGMETIHHFTAADSPLPSDNIKDIAIKGSTGEVFIATAAGLVSFRADATRGADKYDKTAVYAFPNPVSPDYEGPITIVGLKADTQVRIVATDGHLVNAGTSLGGSYTWNGQDPTGRRVATGVYFVLATDTQGREGIATKITIIN